jgi:PAS domain S-box-containing protein
MMSEARYAAIYEKAFENASLGIAISPPRQGYSLVNKAFSALVGYSQEELSGKTFADITHPDDVPANKELVRKLVRKEIPFYDYEKRFIHKNGTFVWVKVHASMIALEEDNPVLFVIVRNIEPEIRAREEQQKLLTLVENSVELMSILEMDGRNSYLNKAGRDMLGFDSVQQVMETPISELHAPEDFEQVNREVLPSVLVEGRWSGTMQVRHLKTGEIFPVHNNTIRIDDRATGKPLAVGAVMRDLRSEMSARAALLESEKRWRIMIEQAPVAIGLLRGRDLVIEAANESIHLLWGKKNVVGMRLVDALPEIQGQPFVGLLEKVFDTGEAFYGYETKAVLERNNRSEEVYFNFVYAPVHESGKSSGILVIATEVTQQVNSRRELEASEQRFRNLIMEAPMATAVYMGKDMTIQLANDAMIRLWGKDHSVIGKPLLEALPEIKDQDFPRLLNQVFESGRPYHSADHPGHLNVDGKLQAFYFNFAYKPLKDANGHVYGILNMAVDVTRQKLIAEDLERMVQQRTAKLKEANAYLENVNKNLEQFAYITSHDLQEPLRKIRMFSNILQTKFGSALAPDVSAYLDKIAASSKRMSELIQDVLDFSRIEPHTRNFVSVDLNIIVQQLIVDLELHIKDKQASIEVSTLPVIEAVSIQMNQLFFNMLSNALKFTRENIAPVIRISARKLDPHDLAKYPSLITGKIYWELIIEDNGIGFDQNFAENIFIIFQRLHTRDAYEGTGIGLAICRKIVFNHNGAISALGREGIGATFHIILPERQ